MSSSSVLSSLTQLANACIAAASMPPAEQERNIASAIVDAGTSFGRECSRDTVSLDTMDYCAKRAAAVSNLCYDEPQRRPKELIVNWQQTQGTYELDTSINEPGFCVYANSRDAVLGFKGTDTASDVVMDVAIVINKIFRDDPHIDITEQLTRARASFTERHSEQNKFVTGHSLGGAYACKVALGMDSGSVKRLDVFNSAPIPSFSSNLAEMYVHHHIKGDVVSFTTRNHTWREITYEFSSSSTHSLNNFLDGVDHSENTEEPCTKKRRL